MTASALVPEPPPDEQTPGNLLIVMALPPGLRCGAHDVPTHGGATATDTVALVYIWRVRPA